MAPATRRSALKTTTVVAEPVEDTLDEAIDSNDGIEDENDDDNELDIEAGNEEDVHEEIPETPAATVAPTAQWETPTGTPIQVIHKCNHHLTGVLTELLANPQYCKRVVAILNGSTPADANGKRPGDYWLEEVNRYQAIVRQATNALVAEAMNQ